jgi:hypothetical protein
MYFIILCCVIYLFKILEFYVRFKYFNNYYDSMSLIENMLLNSLENQKKK